MESSAAAEALIPRFKLDKLLNQGQCSSSARSILPTDPFIDQGGRRITLLGSIDSRPALLTFERAAFPTSPETIQFFHSTLTNVTNLGANDIYAWYLASTRSPESSEVSAAPDLKLNLIFPCKESHIKKYSPQTVRMVIETPAIYTQYVRPYMQLKREEGRLNWVFNIIEGRTEQEDVILRDSKNPGHDDEGFLLLPDMNWDRKTMSSLRLLGLVERRDIWSLRDLKKGHVEWLRRVRTKILDAVTGVYPGVEKDMLKLYMHCESLIDLVHPYLTSYPEYQDYMLTRNCRPAYILPLPYPRHQYQTRTEFYSSRRQSFRTREHNLPTRDHGRRS